jgi:hypothetical protein
VSQLWKEWEQLEPGCVAIVEGIRLRARLCRNCGRNGSSKSQGCVSIVAGMGAERTRLYLYCE